MPEQPTISLCMIVRDARQDLARALDSAAPFVDEMVVVDTGSIDGTPELAAERGARVFHHPWEHDFAKHRNQSIAYAGGDWLLVLDADEELAQGGPVLRQVCRSVQVDCLFLEIRHLNQSGGHTVQWTPRLFRAGRGLCFEGAIHESLVGGDGRAQRAPLALVHHGFAAPPAVLAAKAARNLDLLRRWAVREPANPEPLAYIAQTLAGDPAGPPEALAEGLAAARTAIRLAGAGGIPPARAGHFHHPLIMLLTRLGDTEGVIRAAEECLALAPDLPDPLFSLAWAHYRLGRWAEVCRAAAHFRDLQAHWAAHPMDYPYTHNRSLGESGRVYAMWLAAAARLGDRDQAAQAAAALAAAPDRIAAVQGLEALLADDPASLDLARAALARAGGASSPQV